MDLIKKQEIDRLWSKLKEKGREIREELAVCRRQARRTKRYENLIADEKKLREEYEKLKGGATHNPLSVESNESALSRNVFGSLNGTVGPESHHK